MSNSLYVSYTSINKRTNTCNNMDESLKNITLCERSQTLKTTYYMIPFVRNFQKKQNCTAESKSVFAYSRNESDYKQAQRRGGWNGGMK